MRLFIAEFRSSTTFEALPLPGTAARLFDVKKAIVKQKRLDVGGMDFELEVHDANTNQQYVDESMLLPLHRTVSLVRSLARSFLRCMFR